MAYREFPAELVPNENSLILNYPSFGFTSAFTGVQQNIIHPGARWTLEMTFTMLQGRRKQMLSAFLNGMQGRVEAVKVYDHSSEGRPPMGVPTVSGDGQLGRKLLTMGWIAGQKVLSIGDQFTVNNELKEVSEDVWSDINGFATIEFNPPLRKSPPNSAPLETEKPYMLATLGMDGVGRTNSPAGFGSFETITFKEAIYR
ncbi:distal tail protein [Vibrio phage K394]